MAPWWLFFESVENIANPTLTPPHPRSILTRPTQPPDFHTISLDMTPSQLESHAKNEQCWFGRAEKQDKMPSVGPLSLLKYSEGTFQTSVMRRCHCFLRDTG